MRCFARIVSLVVFAAVVVAGGGAGGCSRVRLVVDLVPAEDKLTETVVMEDDSTGWGADKIALIDVTGLIVDASKPGLFSSGENPVARFAEALQRASDDDRVKAIILRINSPGGTVTASDVMYREVHHFKEQSGKPVIVLMADVAASGGYYLACAGDEIIAHPTTITGSIGVIIQTINFAEGMKRIGIKAESITSGPNKAVGSPFEPMPQEHRELLQGLVDEFYGGFKSVVVSARPNVADADLEWITDGRVVTGARAAAVGLVDAIGDLHAAFSTAKRRAGVESARLVKYHRPIEYVGSAYSLAPMAQTPGAGQINLMQVNLDGRPWGDAPAFWYLWDPAIP